MDWPHAPPHRLEEHGTFIVTGATHMRIPHLMKNDRRERFMLHLFSSAKFFQWKLHAWAILNDHYHFIADSPEDAETLTEMTKLLHRDSAREFNTEDEMAGRQVWFQFWETKLTYHRSYMTRLKYVHNNPVKHKLCLAAENYRWCSKAWHIRTSSESFRKILESFDTDSVNVYDDFD